ncbi:MAG TPA: AAA family ATPase, partial [Chlamydiales bacterium]|nr:AAA family ATPase [Chlamydiales bacterium]
MTYLSSLYLRNFRNFPEKEVVFSPKINQIWGDNGRGKTNLLEAIYLLSMGRSFRTSHFSELILENEERFYLEAEYLQEGRSLRLSLSFDGKKKWLQIDGAQYSTFQPLLGLAPLILHTPQDSALVDGSPTLRRRLLNLHLAQSDPLYVHHLARFWRAMKQRNCLLKSRNDASIRCWEEEMVPSALYLLEQRTLLI